MSTIKTVLAAEATPADNVIVNTNRGRAFIQNGQWYAILPTQYAQYPSMTVPCDDVITWEEGAAFISVEDDLPEDGVVVETNLGYAIHVDGSWQLVSNAAYNGDTVLYFPTSGVTRWRPAA